MALLPCKPIWIIHRKSGTETVAGYLVGQPIAAGYEMG
jgi:hypothetical protein